MAGNFIYLLYFDTYNPNPDFIYDSFYNFEAVVQNQDKKLNGWNIVAEPIELDNFRGQILIYAPLYPEYGVGDILEASCKINKPEPIVDDGGDTFAYDKYLAKDGIVGVCFRPYIKVVGQQDDFNYYLFNTKQYLWLNLNSNLTEPASSLAKAISLGARREIPDSLRASFAQVGISHMIAISGLHMAIIILMLQYFLISIGLSRKKAMLFLFLIIFAYLYMLGFPSSALRASLMVFMMMIGPLIGRQTVSIFSLVFLADIFILANPYLLLYDVGFQLSFLAVLGLLLYINYFNKVLIFLPNFFKIREVFSVTLAAQVFTWPIVVYNFKILSIVAPIANFIILPILPFVLVCSFLLAIFGFFYPLTVLLSWPLIILFKLMVDIVQFLSKIPFAYVMIDIFSIGYLLLSFIFMIIITLILKPYHLEE